MAQKRRPDVKIKPKKKHSRRHIIAARLKHKAKLQRVACLYGMTEPWKTLWVKQASHKYSPRDWCNYDDDEPKGPSYQTRKLNLRDDAEDDG